MASLDVLYFVLTICSAVITLVIVWLANDLIVVLRNIRKASKDTAGLTSEFKQKVLMVGEALDRMGDSATRMLGIMEDSQSEMIANREKIKKGVGLIVEAENKKVTTKQVDESKTVDKKKKEA